MNTEKTPKLHLAILGVGLIGGAFGMALKDKLQDDIFITGNFFPNANPLFPYNEYPNQLFGTSLKLNHASISLVVSPCVALVYKK